MRRNIILKSMFRQPVRTILLALLLCVATFFFVSRGAEYQIVTSETERIAGHYRSIGFFAPIRASADETDLTDVLEVISDSPYFDFGVHSRFTLATLNDMYNTNFHGKGHARGYRRLYNINPDIEIEAVFYGELLSKRGPSLTHIPYYTLEILVDDVLAGYPEQILVGYEIIIRWELEEGVEALYEQLEVGNRYFFNTSRDTGTFSIMGTSAAQGWHYLELINEDEELWFVRVEVGEELDFATSSLSHIPALLEHLDLRKRMMYVSTSVDMGIMPRTQEIVDEWFLQEGRWLDYEDNETGNQVAVVNWLFAQIRGLDIGDSITMTFRDLNIADFYHFCVYCCDGFIPHARVDNIREHETYEVTFEIIGLFAHCRHNPTWGPMTRDMFVPESTVPTVFGETDYISHLRYSFVLTSTRHQEAFWQENQEKVSALGFEIRFVEHGAERFWESANPILRSLTLNFMLFSGVFLATVILIILLYFRQRQREFAILRALGCPAKKVVRQLFMPAFLLWLPLVLVGSLSGWVSAHNAAAITLESIDFVDEIEGERETEIDSEDEMDMLLGFFAVAFAIPLLALLLGAVRMSYQPVLELLQDTATRAEKKKRKREALRIPEESIVLQLEKIKDISALLTNLEISKSNKGKGIRRNSYRRMGRSPAKTMLAFAIAFLFIIAIGWLNRAIVEGDAEIDRLYDTTIVRGEIRPLVPGDFNPHFPMHQVIAPRTVTTLLESGIAGYVYLEAGFDATHLIVPAADGSFPEGIWEEQEFTNDNLHRLFAIDDLNTFLAVHDDPVDIFGEPLGVFAIHFGFGPLDYIVVEGEAVEITFMENFDKSMFAREMVYDFDSIVPIILRYDVAANYGLAIGEMAFLSHNFANVDPWRMKVQVVGTYTGRMHRIMAHEASVFPLSALEPIREIFAGSEYADLITGYITVRFGVDPVWNREIDSVREMLEAIVTRPRAGAVHLTYDLFDGELEFVVRQMEQNLYLLQLLYPVAIAVSLLIAVGLSFLLMFQNTKNAAVMRVLGMPKGKVRQLLVAEQGVITLLGVILALIVLSALGAVFGSGMSILLFAVAYVGATLLGSLLGAILVSNRSPLDLLQVKE